MAYGKGIARGMGLTIKSLFREPATIQYPEVVRDIPVYARTNLLWFEERCTGCSTCAQACPDGCILVATSQDPEGRRNIDRYAQGRTLILITHRLHSVLSADLVVCIVDGRVVEQGAPAELMQRPGGALRGMLERQDEE